MEKCKTCEYYIENEPNGLTGMCIYCRDGENYKRKIDTMKVIKETIISAAVHFDDGKEYLFQKCYGIKTGFVIGTFRHPYVNGILALNPKCKTNDFPLQCDDYKVYQGFITSLGRYVDRNEAYEIAINSEQVKPEDCYGTQLYSEDIFPEQMFNDKGNKIL